LSKNEFKIEGRLVGEKYPPLVIAEIGINHNGDFGKAIKLVDAAAEAGAEIVKFQCHITDKEMIKTNIKPANADEPIWDIIKRCELTESEELKIQEHCKLKNIIFLSTPFSREASDRLERMKVSCFKIGSGECNNLPLIDHVAKKRKPIILSTGMNNTKSIKDTVRVIDSYNCPLVILHCTSMYPTPYENVRLGAIRNLKKEFPNAHIGLSDHSLGIATSIAAVSLGACILEKHFTISKDWAGPDNIISIDPLELSELINSSKNVWKSLIEDNSILEEEKPVIDFAYASVVSIKKINKGEKFSLENIWVKRPGNGKILSKYFEKVLGCFADRDIEEGKQISEEDIANYNCK